LRKPKIALVLACISSRHAFKTFLTIAHSNIPFLYFTELDFPDTFPGVWLGGLQNAELKHISAKVKLLLNFTELGNISSVGDSPCLVGSKEVT